MLPRDRSPDGFPSSLAGRSPWLAGFPDDALGYADLADTQGSGSLVIDEDDPVLAQEPDDVLRSGGGPHVGPAPGTPPTHRRKLCLGENQVKRGQALDPPGPRAGMRSSAV